MTIEIKAPTFPESVADGTIATWHKKPGEAVARDELLVDIETDKVVLEVVAPAAGVLEAVLKNEGDTVLSEELIARIKEGAVASIAAAPATPVTAAATPASDAKLAPAARKLIDEKGLNAGSIAPRWSRYQGRCGRFR